MFDLLTIIFIFTFVGLIGLLPFGILKYYKREKIAIMYANSILKKSEHKDILLTKRRIVLQFSKVLLLLSPIYIVIFPLLFHKYTNTSWILVIGTILLLVTTLYVEYRYQNWMYKYLTNVNN
jgi:hypothetical protein